MFYCPRVLFSFYPDGTSCLFLIVFFHWVSKNWTSWVSKHQSGRNGNRPSLFPACAPTSAQSWLASGQLSTSPQPVLGKDFFFPYQMCRILYVSLLTFGSFLQSQGHLHSSTEAYWTYPQVWYHQTWWSTWSVLLIPLDDGALQLLQITYKNGKVNRTGPRTDGNDCRVGVKTPYTHQDIYN